MNVLALGKMPSPLVPIIRDSGCNVAERSAPVDEDYLGRNAVDFIVSYGYRHILEKSVIEHLGGTIINLHISLLPWNRGADPNLWSFLENTPKGVTIHYVDEGLDTGDIISQLELFFDEQNDTLKTTYEKLSQQMVELFKNNWPNILSGNIMRKKQPSFGSFHRLKDKERFNYLLAEKGWETPVRELIGKAL
jgi:methionyl-tRNA formyltransferase